MAIVKWGFRRFYSSRQALSEISHLVAGSNVQQPERSYAASVTSKKPIRGKVAIAARKKMLESFVDKYRAMNQGKFPSVSIAKKEVGGGFYSVKKMLQEMEYNIKVSSAEKEPVKDDKSKTVMKEIAIESLSGSQEVLEDHGLESVSSLDTKLKAEQKHEIDTPEQPKYEDSKAEKQHDETQNSVTDVPELQKDEELQAEQKHEIDTPEQPKYEDSKAEKQHDETQNSVTDVPELQKDEELQAEHKHEIDTPEQPKYEDSKAEKQHDETKNRVCDVHELQKDEEFREKLSLWGNLKILATGLINIWKK